MAEEKQSITFEEQLNKNGYLVWTNVGVSMMPLLREKRDLMVIHRKTPDRPCRRLDAVLFVRPETRGRGRYVLHRILKVYPDGTYWIVGDNCTAGECVREEHILGILTEVIRDGKTIRVTDLKYRLYVNLWCAPYPLRIFIMRAYRGIRARIGTFLRR